VKNSKIEWTNHTANLWHGCTKVHEGCDNCYAEALSKRWGDNVWGNDNPRKEVKSIWNQLSNMQNIAEKAGEVHRVFVGSMMDIFEKPMPLIDSKGNAKMLPILNEFPYKTEVLRKILFEKIQLGHYPNLDFLLLTKRPSNINRYIPDSWRVNPPKNVMFGTSPVNQQTFDTLVSQLKRVNGTRFLSIEPQIGGVELGHLSGIDWIIQGGESGKGKRPFDLEWARSMRDECMRLGIPYFFKQIDKVQPIPEDLQVREFPKSKTIIS
jgi:protein gp37